MGVRRARRGRGSHRGLWITKSRGADVPAAVLGRYGGTILSDSHGAWNHVGGRHQKCLLHYFRDMYKTLERNGSSEFSLFFNRLYWILKDAISAAGPGDKAADCGAEAEILASKVGELIGAEYEDADCRRYVKRLRRERGHLFTFLEHDVDYHNNISERGLRPFAASRKILYGNRSERGAERTKILMSVYETCKNARGQLLPVYQGLPGRKKRRRFRQAARRPLLPQPPDSRTARRAHGHVLKAAHH